MSILAGHISNKQLMEDTGLGTVIDHYSAMHFGQCFGKLEKMERGLTRSLRQAIWSISVKFGEGRVISFITEVDQPEFTYVGTDHYPQVCEIYKGRDEDLQERLIAWGMAIVNEYKETAVYTGRFDDSPQYADFQDNIFVDYDVKRDFRGKEMIVPAVRFNVPADWETYNTAKKQQLARAINMMIWMFRHGLSGPFEHRDTLALLPAAKEFIEKWRQEERDDMNKLRAQRVEFQPELLQTSPTSYA